MKKETKIQKVNAVSAPIQNEAERLLAMAIEKNVPVETLEKLLAMSERMQANKAKQAFIEAMVAFQKECPSIKKDKKVFEKNSKTDVRYKFADLGGISEQIKDPLAKNGLSYKFNPKQKDGMIGIDCTITHIGGYSETTDPFYLPIGSEQFMSEVQKFGARMTFAKRYVLLMALGINTAEDDTDAVEAEKQQKEIKELENKYIEKINGAKTLNDLAKVGAEIKKNIKPDFAESLRNHYARRKAEIEEAEVEDINAKAAEALK